MIDSSLLKENFKHYQQLWDSICLSNVDPPIVFIVPSEDVSLLPIALKYVNQLFIKHNCIERKLTILSSTELSFVDESISNFSLSHIRVDETVLLGLIRYTAICSLDFVYVVSLNLPAGRHFDRLIRKSESHMGEIVANAILQLYVLDFNYLEGLEPGAKNYAYSTQLSEEI